MSKDPKTPVVFQSFDPQAEVDVRERNLPHWFQAGAATFITFRTADSMPVEVISRWQQELEDWLKARDLPIVLAKSVTGQRLPQHDELIEQFDVSQRREFKKLSDRVFHHSLDECHGKCILRRPELAKIVGEAILFYDDKKYDVDRFVVMPNHVHAIVQFRVDGSLEIVSQSWMRYTARQINAVTSESGAFWQAEPFDHIVRSPEQFEYLQQYVFENPKKANLQKGEFLFWERSL